MLRHRRWCIDLVQKKWTQGEERLGCSLQVFSWRKQLAENTGKYSMPAASMTIGTAQPGLAEVFILDH